MILTVGIRGNGEQLADYVLAMRENSHMQILEIDGCEDEDPDYLRQTIMSMQFNAELTKTNVAFFHAQINPAYGEDKAMTRDDWYKAADMLGNATGFENQRRVIVLHTKKDRIHAHVVWERYNHATGKMVPNKNSKYKANDVRPKIEEALNHKRTNHRNPHQPEMKPIITQLWNNTTTGADFLKAVRKAGYMVATGTGSRPFMIVDENGRSFNLVRQLEGVRTKDVRARLRNEELVTDKRAIEIMRELQNTGSGKREKQKMALTPSTKFIAESFAENRNDTTQENPDAVYHRNIEPVFDEFRTAGGDIAQPQQPVRDDRQRKEEIATQFADNDLSGNKRQDEQAQELQKVIAEQERIRQRRRQRGPHR